jgi:Tol biopolymer transport system component
MNRILRNAQRLQSDWHERIALAIAGAIGVALSTGVIAALIYFLLAVGSLISSPAAYAQAAPPAAGVQLQAGIEKENVDGDLKTAMGIYEKIAADASAPREVRAKALLRLAGCDEKLGKQAKQVYEQILHDYADQPAATQARSRLAAIRQQEYPASPETMSIHKIDREKLGLFGPGDTDGHRVTYIGADGNLYFGDLSGRTKSLVYGSADPEFRKSPSWVVSRDFSIVALILPKTKTRSVTLAVIKIDGTGYRELLKLDEWDSVSGVFVTWSWDDRSLFLYCPGDCLDAKNAHARLWLVSAADGKRREFVHEESTKSIVRATFSPDGQFAAYEVWPMLPASQGATSKVFVVPIAGIAPRLVYESDPWLGGTVPFSALGDWTADGRYLVIKGIRGGSPALFRLPVKNGAAIGSPAFVRTGDFEYAGSTLSGALIFQDQSSIDSVSWHLASVDPDGKIGQWTRIEPNGRPFSAFPSFSPDASQIAYTAGHLHSTGIDLVLKDITTGRERVLYQSAADFFGCQYSANHPIVFCTSSSVNGKTAFFSVSVDSGAMEQIASFPDIRYLLPRPQDDKVFYFAKYERDLTYMDPKVRWDRSTQKESVVVNAAEVDSYMWTLSLDGRWVLRQRNGDLSFRPTSGGDWRAFASGIEGFDIFGSTPDGNWALYVASDPQGHPGIFEASFSGGEPRRVGDLPPGYRSGWGFLVFSPDGRKILAMDGSAEDDLWILENFEPKTSK